MLFYAFKIINDKTRTKGKKKISNIRNLNNLYKHHLSIM